MYRCGLTICFFFSCTFVLVSAQQSINLHPKLSLNKDENTTQLLIEGGMLLDFAKEKALHGSIQIMLRNLLDQLTKMDEAGKKVKTREKTEKVTSFTGGKYKLKEMKKLQAKPSKKLAIPSMTVEEFEKKFAKKLEFDKPFLVKKGDTLLKDFAAARQRFNADSFINNEYLEANTRLEYFPPDQARQKVVGNMIYMTEPSMIPISKFMTICFLGTPAAPKIPGQATEHCEQTVSALDLVEKEEDLDVFTTKRSDGKPLVDNVFYDWEKAAKNFFAGNTTHQEIKTVLGKKSGGEFIKEHASGNFRYFVMGPSGSGDKLHAENGLPFYDVLIHGYRRWLLVTEEEVDKVAQKAREALEFQKTSAYMFFEEKLPELKEEFGLSNYMEANQEPGDIIFVPPGWFRVSLSLADSISYYEQMLYQPPVVESIVRNTIWNPNRRQFNLAFCYPKDKVVDEIRKQKGGEDEGFFRWLGPAISNVAEKDYPSPLMNVLTTCAKIMSSSGKIAKLVSLKKTKCTPEVWKACRGMLVDKMKLAKKDLKLDWLPKDPKDFEKLEGTKKLEL